MDMANLRHAIERLLQSLADLDAMVQRGCQGKPHRLDSLFPHQASETSTLASEWDLQKPASFSRTFLAPDDFSC